MGKKVRFFYMLIKRSSKNQIALPKSVLEQIGMGPEDLYFRLSCDRGSIRLVPVDIEEKLPQETVARYRRKTLKGRKGNRTFRSMETLIADLKRAR